MNNPQLQARFPNILLQQGSVLVISLFILLVLTIIGATALNDTVMEERMSSNFQSGNIAFQATESGVNATFIEVSQSRDKIVEAADAVSDTPRELKDDETWPEVDQVLEFESDGEIKTQTESKTQIVYVEPVKTAMSAAGANLEVGDGDTFSADIVELKATGSVTGSNISRTHIQGVKRLRPGSGQAE